MDEENLRNQLYNHEKTPPPNAWSGIQEGLEKRKRRRFYRRLLMVSKPQKPRNRLIKAILHPKAHRSINQSARRRQTVSLTKTTILPIRHSREKPPLP